MEETRRDLKTIATLQADLNTARTSLVWRAL
jgi:hypothetical protein